MKKIIILVALIAITNIISYSLELESFQLSKIDDISTGLKIPVPSKAVIEEDEMIGIDASIKIPFKVIKKSFLQMAAENPMISLINPEMQVISKSGKNLKISNVRLNINGIIAEPVLLLKPYLEAKNNLAIRIERVKFHVLMTPDKGLKTAESEFNIEDLMQQAMDTMIKGIMKNLNQKFAEKQMTIKAEQVLIMKYNKKDWTLRINISAELIKAFMQTNLIGNLYIIGFSYDETAIFAKIKTDK